MHPSLAWRTNGCVRITVTWLRVTYRCMCGSKATEPPQGSPQQAQKLTEATWLEPRAQLAGCSTEVNCLLVVVWLLGGAYKFYNFWYVIAPKCDQQTLSSMLLHFPTLLPFLCSFLDCFLFILVVCKHWNADRSWLLYSLSFFSIFNRFIISITSLDQWSI